MKILTILQDPNNQHISAEDVYKILLDQNEEIGLATVYRVLNQFDDAGIVTRHHFEGGKSVFELSHKKHHDHLVCFKMWLKLLNLKMMLSNNVKKISQNLTTSS